MSRYNKKASLDRYNELNVGPKWISIRRASEVLGVAPSTLRNWIKQGVVSDHKRDRNGFSPEMSKERAALTTFVGGNPYREARFYQCLSMSELGHLVRGESFLVLEKAA